VEPSLLEPIAAQAIARGVKVVPYPRPLTHQTAAIVFDVEGAARSLARGAAEWAQRQSPPPTRALLVLPPSECTNENALCSDAGAIEEVWRKTLLEASPDLEISTTTEALGALGGAEVLAPLVHRRGFGIVLAWNDEPIAGLARALRHHPPPGRSPRDLYLGALGAPVVASRLTFEELRQDGPLQAVIAARLGDLAGAMVELPHALLSGRRPASITLPTWTLAPGLASLASYERDYLTKPPHGTITYEAVALNPSAFH
jgi:hypothetical protein